MKVECKLCGELIDKKSFTTHLCTHNISEKDYYDLYLKKDEKDGECPTCGGEPTFHGIWIGYSKHCNTSCSAADPEVVAKKNNTMIRKYGFKSHFSDSTTQQHIKESYIKNLGVDNPAKSKKVRDKTVKTCQEKYGTDCPFQNDKVKAKIAKTCQEKYNVDNPFKSHELMKNAYLPETRLRAYRTHQKNGNTSSLETFLEDAFIANSINYNVQYKLDCRYPYFCDFYLPDNDIFIEINGFWTHGGHWFDENNEDDINTLAKWKELLKYHSMYEAAIRQWTKSDLEKRECARKHKLNYVVLWTMADIQNWIDTGFEIRHDY